MYSDILVQFLTVIIYNSNKVLISCSEIPESEWSKCNDRTLMIEWLESDDSSEESSDESFDNFRRFWVCSIDVPAERFADFLLDRPELKL